MYMLCYINKNIVWYCCILFNVAIIWQHLSDQSQKCYLYCSVLWCIFINILCYIVRAAAGALPPQAAAQQQLGRLPGPSRNKTETKLFAAQVTWSKHALMVLIYNDTDMLFSCLWQRCLSSLSFWGRGDQ